MEPGRRPKVIGLDGLDRRRAAALLSQRIGRPIPYQTLRYWESRGLVKPTPAKCRGPAYPTRYRLQDLVAAEILATLRWRGASLHRLRRALRELAHIMPGISDAPQRWQLAVTPAGEVVRVESDTALLLLTRTPGQLVFVL